jgi:ABC-2 type transport system ATP-binding protein
MIELQHVTKTYGGKAALHDISLTLPQGQLIGLIGPNGSGKSTLLKLLAGQARPNRGSVLVNGKPSLQRQQSQIAYLADGDVLYPFYTVKETVEWYSKLYVDFDLEKARDMLCFLELDAAARVGSLSKGHYARLKMALVCARRVPLLIMDEPLSGLDPIVRRQIVKGLLSFVELGEQTVVLSTHEVDEIEPLLDRVVVLREGRLCAEAEVESIRETHGKGLTEWLGDVLRMA